MNGHFLLSSSSPPHHYHIPLLPSSLSRHHPLHLFLLLVAFLLLLPSPSHSLSQTAPTTPTTPTLTNLCSSHPTAARNADDNYNDNKREGPHHRQPNTRTHQQQMTMPKLPSQFAVHVEATLVEKQRTMEAVEVYDHPNGRAAMSVTSSNETVTSIFSYRTGERVDILANGTCHTHKMSDGTFPVLGFTQLTSPDRPLITPASVLFRLGDGIKKFFIGEESVRGVAVYHWQTCQTLTRTAYVLDLYFSKPNHETATGETLVPVRALLNGTTLNVDARGVPTGDTHRFSHVYDFSFFRSGPVDETLFEVPRGTVCKRFLSKTLPQLPDQFSLSMEVQVRGSEHPPRTERMLFDYDFGLIQTERFAPRGTGERFGLTQLRIVEDYTNHVQYVVDTYDGNCSVSPLPEGLSTSEGGESTHITMRHAQELLKYGQRDFKYQGQRWLRDLKVDVWADDTDEGMVQEVYFLADWPSPRIRARLQSINSDLDLSRMNMLVGTYLLNTSAIQRDLGPFFQLFGDKALKSWGGRDRWTREGYLSKSPGSSSSSSSSSFSSTLPRPGELLRLRMAKRRMRWDSARMHFPDASEKMINIFNYVPMHMDLSAFDVSMCYRKSDQELYVFFAVDGGSYSASVVTDQRYSFLSAVRSAVAGSSGVSMLRVAKVMVWQDVVSNRLNIFFCLLGPPPLTSTTTTTSTSSSSSPTLKEQISCRDALRNWQDAVRKGVTIRVKHLLKTHELHVVKDSVRNWSSMDRRWNGGALPKGAGGLAGGLAGGAVVGGDQQSEDSSSSSSSGYTAGQFGGMAFAMLVVGAGVGVGGMYLVLRRLRPDIHLLPYQQSK
ncbi:uncharacterized protein LOC143297977 [Babylonia areolata]|uniref:uncharacterized protein LOC143297977 n=1 Tax=Babylonia areolata TaxID=304850 RepID=UPI003FD39545